MWKFIEERDPVRLNRQGRRVGCFLQLLVFEELDGLWNAVFGDGEVFGGESFDRVAALVFDDDGLDHKLRADLERRVFLRGGVMSNLLSAHREADKKRGAGTPACRVETRLDAFFS